MGEYSVRLTQKQKSEQSDESRYRTGRCGKGGGGGPGKPGWNRCPRRRSGCGVNVEKVVKGGVGGGGGSSKGSASTHLQNQEQRVELQTGSTADTNFPQRGIRDSQNGAGELFNQG